MTITDRHADADAVDNGVDVDALLGARVALTEAPDAAAFTWRADCTWIDGTHARTEVSTFDGLGQRHEHLVTHVVETDHPAIVSSADRGMTPPEMLLAALGGCLTAGVASVATKRGVELRSVRAVIEGDMDLRGILGVDPDVRNGFSDIRVRFEISADADPDEIRAIVDRSQRRSAVFDALNNPTNVVVTS